MPPLLAAAPRRRTPPQGRTSHSRRPRKRPCFLSLGQEHPCIAIRSSSVTSHRSRVTSDHDSFHSLLASAGLSSRPRTKTRPSLARFSLFAPSLLPLVPHSSSTFFPLSPLLATLTNIPRGGPPPLSTLLNLYLNSASR